MTEPLPDSGWSREIRKFKDAIVCPQEAVGFKQPSGVYSEEGDCMEAAIWREGKRLTLAIDSPPQTDDYLPGKHLWGGVYFGHFGHFLAETIARLWAVQDEKPDSILFIPKHAALKPFSGYQLDICRLLGVDVPIQIIREPTKVNKLIVPGQGFGLGKISRGTPEFWAMMQNMADHIEGGGPEKIYISRTQFNGKGGILNETALEANMEELGYTVIHPQRMPVEEQLHYYKSATHVIGLDSSAFHLFGFVAKPEQNAAIILRRNAKAYQYIAEQMDSVLGRPPVIINALLADWMPETQKFANHLSWGEIDHQFLAQELERTGFINAASDWNIPDETANKDAIEKAEKTSKADLVRRPIDDRI